VTPRVSVHETLMFAESKPEGQLKLTLWLHESNPMGYYHGKNMQIFTNFTRNLYNLY
tara:strand:- start:163 stop:333 length:171 start_codon:yes stop_codon:yes gene_type:complete